MIVDTPSAGSLAVQQFATKSAPGLSSRVVIASSLPGQRGFDSGEFATALTNALARTTRPIVAEALVRLVSERLDPTTLAAQTPNYQRWVEAGHRGGDVLLTPTGPATAETPMPTKPPAPLPATPPVPTPAPGPLPQFAGAASGVQPSAAGSASSPLVARSLPSEKVTLAADAFFEVGKSSLPLFNKAKLDDLVSRMAGLNLEVIIAVGHTDASEGGSDAARQKLSVMRADAIKDYLTSKGVEKNRVYTEGKGGKQPVADNKTVEGRAKNRRVEIEVVGTRAKK